VAAGGQPSGVVLTTNPVFLPSPYPRLFILFSFGWFLLGPTLEIHAVGLCYQQPHIEVSQSQAPKGRVGKGFKIANCSAEIWAVWSIPVSLLIVIAICYVILGAYVFQNI